MSLRGGRAAAGGAAGGGGAAWRGHGPSQSESVRVSPSQSESGRGQRGMAWARWRTRIVRAAGEKRLRVCVHVCERE